MTTFSTVRRRALAVAVAVAAFASVAPAQANASDASTTCDVRLERLEAQFYDMAERRGYYEATEWWDARWQAYFRSCILH